MPIFRIGRRLYWPDGEPMPQNAKLAPGAEVLVVPNKAAMFGEITRNEVEIPVSHLEPEDAARVEHLMYGTGPDEDDYSEDSSAEIEF